MDKHNKRVLISCPVRDRQWILPHYLEHIYNLTYPKHLIDIYWVINNSTDNSYELLKQFKEKYQHEYNSIFIEVFNSTNIPKDARTSEIRNNHIYSHLANLRNKTLSKCVKLNCDYLLSSDCDILLKSDTIERLLESTADVTCSIIFNGYLYTPPNSPSNYSPIDNAYKFPNILKLNPDGKSYSHIVNYRTKNPNLNPKQTYIPVDFSGASMLVKKEVCEKARFDYNIQGEDEPFFRTAIANGFITVCDLSIYQQHIMSPTLLDLYLQGKLTYPNGEVIEIK